MPKPPRNSDRNSDRQPPRPSNRSFSKPGFPKRGEAPRPIPPWSKPRSAKPRRSPDAVRGDAARAAQGSAELPEELRDSSRGDRLQKVLAAAGIAARRECEKMILSGRVTVNGHRVLTLPAWADPFEDRIEVDGRVIARPSKHTAPVSIPIPGAKQAAGGKHAQPGKGAQHGKQLGKQPDKPGKAEAGAAARAPLKSDAIVIAPDRVYIALNKPRNTITTASDPEGRTSVLDLVELPPNYARRIFPVGRLDADSTGLLILTNDGELANRLTHPRYGVVKEYLVSVKGALTPADVEQLQSGLYLAHPTKGRGRSRPPGAGPGAERKSVELLGTTAGKPPRPTRGTPFSYDPQRDEAAGTASTLNPATATGAVAGVRVKKAAMEDVVVLEQQRDVTRGDRTRLLVRLREGQNREIRRLMARLGFKVRRLQRVAIGPVTLKGLPVGGWRMLTPHEVRGLMRASMEQTE